MTQISKVGVIGAGNMGSGIVQKLAQEGIPVVMIDTQTKFVERGLANIAQTLQDGVRRKIIRPAQVDEILGRIQATIDLEAVADADLVIEAVFEDKAVKSELFKKLDRICSYRTIFATNTSSFYIKEFAEQTSRPDRFIGLHYFYHPAKNRLLEIIPHDRTSPATVEIALLIAKLHAKTAIVVKDEPGFAVNRFFVPFLNEAVRMLEEGLAGIATIEEGAKRAFKIGMGPFELMNVTGIPIAVHAATTLGNELGPFYAPAKTLQEQLQKKQNWDLSGPVDEFRLPAVSERFYGVCLGVAAALVNEGVATVEDTDRGAKIGLRWSLGPFEIMNKIGIDKTYQVVKAVADKYSDFVMPQILTDQKELGKPFYFNYVDLAVKDGIAMITINRPEAMNALNETVVSQLESCFSKTEMDPKVKAVVFQGAGKAFVAGADIRYFVEKIKASQISDIVDFTRKGHRLLLKIETSVKPTIALLDGLSMGGGSELALACQAIVATPAGSIAFPETGIGIYPGLGGMLRLARQIGPEIAKYYVFTGASLRAADMLALGIAARVCAADQIPAAIRSLLQEGLPDKFRQREIPPAFDSYRRLGRSDNIARLLSGKMPEGVSEDIAVGTLKSIGFKAPLALKISNEIIDQQAGRSIAAAIEIELGRLAEIFSSVDALEGLSALGRKRPEFKGK